MKTAPRRLLRDLVSVRERIGEGAYEPIYADPVTVFGKVSNIRQLVRNSNAEEVLSEVTIDVHPDDAAPFNTGARVTINGRVSMVITVAPQARLGKTVLVKVACS